MSQSLVIDSYSFNKTAKTITFNQFSSIRLEGIKLITNVTTGTIIYQFNASTKLGTVSGNILTLAYDTSAMSNTDNLMIIYDPPAGGFFDQVSALLRFILETLRAPAWSTATGTGQKINVIMNTESTLGAVTSLATLTTCATVTNLVNLNSIDSRQLIWRAWDTEYNTGIRSKIV